MGMPEIVINFREDVGTFLYRLGRGIVCYVHIDAEASTPEYYRIDYKTDTDTVLASATGKDELVPIVKRMFDFGASRIIVAVATAFTAVEDWLELQRFNYLALVSSSTADSGIMDWCEGIEFRAGRKFMLIWDSSETATDADMKRFVVSVYPASSTKIPYGTPMDIAAVIAGSSDRSATYVPLVYNNELTEAQLALYPGYKSATANEKIDAGQLTIVNDGEKIKVGRAVTTFYKKDTDTPSNDTTKRSFAKVRPVDIMNMIEDDIRDNFDNQYVGQVLNSYENKMSFINLINSVYLAGLEGTALDPDGENRVDIDVEAHIQYIKEEGKDPTTMTEAEIRKYNTGDKVYLAGSLRILDTMEDLVINFVI